MTNLLSVVSPFKFTLTLTLSVRQRISYAKTKSWATLKKENPNFIPPNSANAPKQPPAPNGTEKREREAETVVNERAKKREKASHDDDDDAEEMEIDEDEEQQANRDAGLSYSRIFVKFTTLYSTSCWLACRTTAFRKIIMY
jgi:hypothetical protein